MEAPPEPILAPLATPRPPPSPTNRLPRILSRARARTPPLLSRTLGGVAGAQVSRNPLAETAAVRIPQEPLALGRSMGPGLNLEPLGGTRTPAGTPLTLGPGEVADDLRAVSFTAVVTGTGVFRVADTSAPVLLSVGQALPDTDIVLTSLSSSRAVFTRNDERHTLSLRP